MRDQRPTTGSAANSPTTIAEQVQQELGLGRCGLAIEIRERGSSAVLVVNPTTNLRLPVANGKRERVATPQEAAELIEALPEEDRPL